MTAEKKTTLQQLRESVQKLRDGPVGKAVDVALDATDKVLGPSGKAWIANGLDEVRQAVALGQEQVQPGNNPGLWGNITTGEATAERMAGDMHSALARSYEIPEKSSMAELRESVKEQQKTQELDRGKDRQQEMER